MSANKRLPLSLGRAVLRCATAVQPWLRSAPVLIAISPPWHWQPDSHLFLIPPLHLRFSDSFPSLSCLIFPCIGQ